MYLVKLLGVTTLLLVGAARAQLYTGTVRSLLDRYSQEENRQWAALNTTVSGRLYATVPFELPCFSTYNGHPVTTDAAACTSIQDNYTDPVFRVAHFGAYMIVSSISYALSSMSLT